MGRLFQGRFERPRELVAFVAVNFSVIAAAIFTARLRYPTDGDFGILRCSVSYLGSFDQDRNPDGWIFFSFALVLLSFVIVPLILIRHRAMLRFLSPTRLITGLTRVHLLGALGVFLLGVIPDGEPMLFGKTSFNDVHDLIAQVTFGCIGGALSIDGLLLLGDRLWARPSKIYHRWMQWPYLVFGAIALLAPTFLLTWDWKCAHDPGLKPWPGPGIYSFPLWEWILFCYLFGMHAWVALVYAFDERRRRRLTDD